MLSAAPLGIGSRLRHVVGSDAGGGFEWFGSPATSVADGVTALALTPSGRIARATTAYDSPQLAEADRRKLILCSTAA